MQYIDGFVAAVPNSQKQAFIDHARIAADVFKRHGAIRTVENWGDDVPDGELTSFPMAVQCEADETVVFSWIEWPDKATCEEAARKMESDPRWQEMPEMPFDGKRMIWAGFDPILDTDA